MMRTLSVVGLLFMGGCGTTKIVQYAEPMPERVRAPMRLDMSQDGPWKRKTLDVVDHDVIAPEPEAAPEPARTNAQAIREANEAALYEPKDAEEEGAVRKWVYDPDVTYRVFTCPLETFQVRLAVGERLTADVVFGTAGTKDARLWTLIPTESGDGHGNKILILNLRPNLPKIPKQRMQVYTNVGPYDFELNVLPKGEDCMHAVRFRHPQHELNQMMLDNEQTDAVSAKLATKAGDGCTSANYEIEVREGSPRWVPTMVWRECSGDRAQVHIQFRGDVAWAKIPSLQTDGGVADYRFDPAQKVMTVHGLFTHAVLQLGSKETGYERVAVHALKDPAR